MAKHKIPRTLLPLATPIGDLTPFPGNPRIGNVDAIAASLTRRGQYRPIVANKRTGHVLAGNHTLAAALSLEWTAIATTWISIPEEEEAAIVLADNRLADLGRYDDAAILALLEPLSEDLDGTGYDAVDVMAMIEARDDEEIAKAGPIQDPGAGAKPEKPKTKPGDVYLLGDHVLVCGDSTDPATHELLGDELAAAMWTDPPFGVSYQKDLTPEQAKKLRRRTDGKEVANDELRGAELEAFLGRAFDACRLEKGAAVYVAAPGTAELAAFLNAMVSRGWFRSQLVWKKNALVLGRADYHGIHENVLYGWVPGSGHDWRGGRKQTTVHEYDRPSRSPEHPTMKPIDLIVRHLTNSTAPGALVLDPFGGSGSTLIACEETKRRCHTIELDPGYCDVIVRRWEGATGKKATRRRGSK